MHRILGWAPSVPLGTHRYACRLVHAAAAAAYTPCSTKAPFSAGFTTRPTAATPAATVTSPATITSIATSAAHYTTATTELAPGLVPMAQPVGEQNISDPRRRCARVF